MRNDDAIAPVIAVMFILVIILTLLSVYTTTYLPGLKQSAEVQHMHDVEEGIAKFGSAIEEAASLKRPLSLSEPVVLGGGDILLHSARSAGSIRVEQEREPFLTIEMKDNSNNNYTLPLRLVNFSYWPIDNFWVDQGYSWQYGFVNVSKVSGDKWSNTVPLQYSTMEKVEAALFGNSTIARTFIDDQCTSVGCNNRTIYAVNMVAGTSNFTSGNGIARFELKAEVNKTTYPGIKSVSYVVGDTPFHDIRNWTENSTLADGNITLIMTTITVSTS